MHTKTCKIVCKMKKFFEKLQGFSLEDAVFQGKTPLNVANFV